MSLTKDDFEMGQDVLCKHTGNKSRYSEGTTTGKVVKIGRKYITVALGEKGLDETQFEVEEGSERDYLLEKTNYTGDYELFPSKRKYLEYEEKQEKIRNIKNFFPRYGDGCTLSIDQVRRIYDIVNE